MTNGEKLKETFPNIDSRLDANTGIMLVKWADDTTKCFKASWWNSEYKFSLKTEAAAKAEQADKKKFISADEAIAILPEGEYIHTFRESGLALIGADWLREEIIELIRKSDCLELTGEGARSMGHGLAIYDHDAKMQSDILFVETDMEKLQALDPDEEAAD